MIEFVGPRNLEGHRTQQVPRPLEKQQRWSLGKPRTLARPRTLEGFRILEPRKTQEPRRTQDLRRIKDLEGHNAFGKLIKGYKSLGKP